MKKKAVVIGAGFSGLAGASVLASNGYDVRLLEKNEMAGGRARAFKAEGFTFDMGPSWYWLPDVFEDYFAKFGKLPSDYYKLVRLDPSYRVFYTSDEYYDMPSGVENIAGFFEKMEPGSGDVLRKFIKEAEFKYNIGIRDLVYKPALSWAEYAQWRIIAGMMKVSVLKSFHSYIRNNFKNPRLHPLLEFPVIFLGSTPKRTPSLYSLMNYADMGLGTWYPMGGFHEVIKGMAKLAESLGVEIQYNTPVDAIIAGNGRNAKGVNAGGKAYEADVILGSADYYHVEQELLPSEQRQYTPAYWNSRELAPSALLFFLGINKKLNRFLHHNLIFDTDFNKHATDIFDLKKWPDNPLLYVSCTSQTDPMVAPEGMENVMVLIPVSAGLNDNNDVRNFYFDYVIDKLEKMAGEPIREHIIYKRIYSQRDFTSDYNAYKGNAYGLGNTLRQTAVLKPRIKSRKLDNFYYAGQLTTPGPGVPTAIISGQVAAGLIIKDLQK